MACFDVCNPQILLLQGQMHAKCISAVWTKETSAASAAHCRRIIDHIQGIYMLWQYLAYMFFTFISFPSDCESFFRLRISSLSSFVLASQELLRSEENLLRSVCADFLDIYRNSQSGQSTICSFSYLDSQPPLAFAAHGQSNGALFDDCTEVVSPLRRRHPSPTARYVWLRCCFYFLCLIMSFCRCFRYFILYKRIVSVL